MDRIQNQNSVKLNDYDLCFDGTIIIHPSKLLQAIKRGTPVEKIFVTEITDDIKQYNNTFDPPIAMKTDSPVIDNNWSIPLDYLELDIDEYILYQALPDALPQHISNADATIRIQRCQDELRLYRQTGNDMILRALIYVINTLLQHDVMWGVGRGSSVSSYLLYLIRLHDIDSVKYKLSVSDFIRV